jgi:DUF4097 and DUF4098 domain-containing protein YvlB
MRVSSKILGIVVVLALMLAVSASAGSRDEVTRTFTGIKTVKIETVSGDCHISQGNGDEVEVRVRNNYRPNDAFEPSFRDRGKTLYLSEDLDGSCSGGSQWDLVVPKGTRVRFSSASGGLEAEDFEGEIGLSTASGDAAIRNCSGEFDFSTASGDVYMNRCEGEIDASTASGDIELEDCRGLFDCSSASGSVEANGVELRAEGSFTTASGRVEVVVAKTPEYDLTVSSASGRATLDYNGNPLKGSFEFTARVHKGDIISPIDFEHEREYERYDQVYVEKTFKRGDAPLVTLGTASGRVVLKE